LRDRVKVGAILVHPKNSRRINRREIQRERSCANLTPIEVEQTAGLSRTKDGVSAQPRFCGIPVETRPAGSLLTDACRIPLAVQIFQESRLFEGVAATQ
jgi:hypothetical protein